MKDITKIALILAFTVTGLIIELGPKTNTYPSYAKNIKEFITAREPASFNSRRGLDLTIPAGEVAYLTEDVNINKLTILGELHCNESQANNTIELKAQSIIIHGKLQCGQVTNPYNKKFIISLKDSDIDPHQSPFYRGIVLVGNGQLKLFGDTRKAGWTRLASTAQAGDNFIRVKPSYRSIKRRNRQRITQRYKNRWAVGDKIIVGPTGYISSEAETFTIIKIDSREPDKYFLDRPLQFTHWGENQRIKTSAMGTITFDESAEVANLSRSIVIRADETDGVIDEGDGPLAQRGGHVMAHAGTISQISGVEFYKMGQAGVIARYPFHWHIAGDSPGQFVKHSSIHHSYQRCITIHRTNKVTLQNNVCANFKGHGYFLEDGTEIENQIIRNLAINAIAPSENKILLQSDSLENSETQGRFPSVSGFWIAHPNNRVTNNIVSGSVGSGFWMSFERNVYDVAGNNIVATPLTSNTDRFDYNTAHSLRVGITWDGAPGSVNAQNPNNPLDRKIISAHYNPPITPTFRGLKVYKALDSGIYFRGDSAVFKNAILADNGWSVWVAYNQIFKNSVIIGETQNQSPQLKDQYFANIRSNRYRKSGVVLYDGPFELDQVDFVDFSTEASTQTTSSGLTLSSTVSPFTSIGGSNKYINLVSGLRFTPEPIHRAHMNDANEVTSRRHNLSNAFIRDLDGSLTGEQGALLVASRSLGVLPSSNCIDGGNTYRNFLICPEAHTEGNNTFMRWGSSQTSPWSTPFMVRRSDGALLRPFSEWNDIIGLRTNNAYSTANTLDLLYEILPKHQFYEDQSIGATARVTGNGESSLSVAPVIKVSAYGQNCRLGEGAIEVNSLDELYQAEETSFYSYNEDFYYRVIPTVKFRFIADDSPTKATTHTGKEFRYSISCDDGARIEKEVIGKITNVIRGRTSTIIEGWACNYSHSSSIQVKLYAVGPRIDEASRGRKALGNQRKYSYHLGNDFSGDYSGPDIAFKCGKLSKLGRGFRFEIPYNELTQYSDHDFYVKGLSNSGGNDRYIEGSGKYPVN